MAFEKQSMIWKDFYGGISQDDYLTTGKQVLYAENVDLTSSSDYVQMGKNSEWRYTTTDDVNGFIHAESWTSRDIFAYTKDGKIYDTSDWTVESSAIWAEIYTAFRFNGYLYFVSNHGTAPFSRITDANAHNNTSWASLSVNFTLTWDTISSAWGKIYPVVSFLDEFFYIWIWSSVFKVSDWDVVEEFAIFDDNIVWLTRVGWVIKVFTERWTIAFWDGISSSIDSFISAQEPIRAVINAWKIDYIVAWHTDFQAKIKILNGYTLQQLNSARYSTELAHSVWNIEITKPNQLTKIWDTIYFCQDGVTWSDVYRFWTNNPVIKAWFNVALAKDSNWNQISETIKCLYWIEVTATDQLYIWMYSNSQEAFERIDLNIDPTNAVYKTSWYMTLNPIDAWSKTTKKKIEYIMLSTSNCSANETIELQYSIDWAAFSTVQTINSGTSLTRTEIYDHLDEFYELKFKVNFASGWSNATPRLHEIKLVYSFVEDDG